MKILLTPLLVSNFYYFGNNDKMLENSKTELQVDVNKHKIKLKEGKINRNNTNNTPPDGRYAFIR